MPTDKHTSNESTRPAENAKSGIAWVHLALATLAGAALIWLITDQFPSRSAIEPGVGLEAPNVQLLELQLDGDAQFVSHIPPGKVTLLHLWGTWCGPCRMEYPQLDAMVSELDSEGELAFLSVSCESGAETLEGLTRKTYDYLDSINAMTTVYADPNGFTRQNVASRLGQSNVFYPTSILIDQSGIISGVWQGYSPEGVEQIREAIKTLWSRQT